MSKMKDSNNSHIHVNESVPRGIACVVRVRHSALLCTWENTERSSNSGGGVRKTARRSPLCCAAEFGLFSKSLTTILFRADWRAKIPKSDIKVTPSSFQGACFSVWVLGKEKGRILLSSARPFAWSRLPPILSQCKMHRMPCIIACNRPAAGFKVQSHLHLQNLRNALGAQCSQSQLEGHFPQSPVAFPIALVAF